MKRIKKKHKRRNDGKKRSDGSEFSPGKVKEITNKVKLLGKPVCESEGIELKRVEFQQENGKRTLRLYIDKPGGVNINDCSKISRQLNGLIDVYLDLKQAYSLEVSSPGIDCPRVS